MEEEILLRTKITQRYDGTKARSYSIINDELRGFKIKSASIKGRTLMILVEKPPKNS